ncbi:NUDIX hydrolase [Asticcacaulis sp. AC402]|uniref:NUDIX hydrolase n=1 Tax=Asticcacaulis sp. AC402 TaxID=1282361 RepID=UPI000406CFFA|nr:NUDIX domain-containing protein [Asticcacaulis sp. AC402]
MTPIEILAAYARRYPEESAMAQKSCDLLLQASDMLARSSAPAHVTASVLIPQGDSLLTIWHPYLKQWLQPGGHIDAREAVLTAALREAREETGLVCELMQDSELPYDIDCLFVPANAKKSEPDHWHIDFRYLMRAVGRADAPELPTSWVPFIHLGDMTPSLARLARKMQQGFASHCN